MKKHTYLLLLLGFLVGCSTPRSPQLLVRVVDGQSTEVIKSATVTLYDNYEKWLQHTGEVAVGLTNDKGEIQFNKLHSVVYYLEVNYVDKYQTTLTNYPLGVYATSVLKEGERAIVTVGVFDDDLGLNAEPPKEEK